MDQFRAIIKASGHDFKWHLEKLEGIQPMGYYSKVYKYKRNWLLKKTKRQIGGSAKTKIRAEMLAAAAVIEQAGTNQFKEIIYYVQN